MKTLKYQQTNQKARKFEEDPINSKLRYAPIYDNDQ